MSLNASEFAHLTDLKEELFGDGNSWTTHGVNDLSGSFTLAQEPVEKFWKTAANLPALGNAAMLPARALSCQYLHLGGIT